MCWYYSDRFNVQDGRHVILRHVRLFCLLNYWRLNKCCYNFGVTLFPRWLRRADTLVVFPKIHMQSRYFPKLSCYFSENRNPREHTWPLIGCGIFNFFPELPHVRSIDLTEMVLWGFWRNIAACCNESNSMMAPLVSDWEGLLRKWCMWGRQTFRNLSLRV